MTSARLGVYFKVTLSHLYASSVLGMVRGRLGIDGRPRVEFHDISDEHLLDSGSPVHGIVSSFMRQTIVVFV